MKFVATSSKDDPEKSTYWWHEALLTLLSVSSISQLFHLLQIINYVSSYSPGNPVDADSVNFQSSAL